MFSLAKGLAFAAVALGATAIANKMKHGKVSPGSPVPVTPHGDVVTPSGGVSPAPAPRPSGSTAGVDIRQAQAWLNQLGYGPLAVDGIAGPQTQAAAKRFQTDEGLSTDGIIGPNTYAALQSAAGGDSSVDTTGGAAISSDPGNSVALDGLGAEDLGSTAADLAILGM